MSRPQMVGKEVPAPTDRHNVAEYLGTMSAEMATMARGIGMETTAALLDMAALEANALTRETK